MFYTHAYMKTWPKNGEPADFEQLVAPIQKAINFAYNLERKNKDKRIPYKGFDSENHSIDINKLLSAENLHYSEEDQGRDALCILVGLAVQLGIEQGKRIAREDQAIKKLIVGSKLLIARLPPETIDEIIEIAFI